MFKATKSFRFVVVSLAIISLVTLGVAANWTGVSAFSFFAPSEAADASPAATTAPEPVFVGEVTLTATAGTPAGSFTTLKEAFDAINLGTHQGTIVISINADTTEAAPAVLNASGAGAALYTGITISPAGGAARPSPGV